MIKDAMKEFWMEKEWDLTHSMVRPGKKKELYNINDLDLAQPTVNYINHSYPEGLYKHQILGLKDYLQGKDLALATGTASGKSTVFYSSAIDFLTYNEKAKILAVYPMKALAREQEQRWKGALKMAGFAENRVSRIDGDVHSTMRINILKNTSVLLVTPDIIHAWMLPNISNKTISGFISTINMVIVDEVHIYTGVFGSNSAYLFRRLEHLNYLLGGHFRYIVASATIKDPHEHLKALFGREFSIVGDKDDTSEQHELEIFMVDPNNKKDFLSVVSQFLRMITMNSENRFITFVDSRKQTEHIATIVSRERKKLIDRTVEETLEKVKDSKQEKLLKKIEKNETGKIVKRVTNNKSAEMTKRVMGDELEEIEEFNDHLKKLDVLPYRAGFEEHDRAAIQERLTKGLLHGVISTSALELGIDIPHLDIGILIGVPRSGTSFQQRIGRVGRKKPGIVVIINSGDFFSEAVFKDPKEILNRPFAESTLYLENPRIQYIHAMCLARSGGECDGIRELIGKIENNNSINMGEGDMDWPKGFIELCDQERAGVVDIEFQNMKIEAGDFPHIIYPLRDVESQFSIEMARGPERQKLGSISSGQLMREAYPGAVYYYTTVPYRVCQIHYRTRNIKVRREKYYTTKPNLLPVQVFPNLTDDNIYQGFQYGNLILLETNLQIRETVNGFKEKRGPNELNNYYPLRTGGVYFNQPYFTRNYFTTGVIIYHPDLNSKDVNGEVLAQLIYECFLIDIPFERQDINFASGKLKVNWNGMTEGQRFLALYDQTYGSLRLTNRLLETGIVSTVLAKAKDLATDPEMFNLNIETLEALQAIEQEVFLESGNPKRVGTVKQGDIFIDEERISIIMPGSKGLDRFNGNEEFYVKGIFYSPRDEELKYRGTRLSQGPDIILTVPQSTLIPVFGESVMGFYNLESGDITED